MPTLKACLREIVQRHDALRTVFRVIDGVPLQVVQSRQDYEFAFNDLTGIRGSLESASEKDETFFPAAIPLEAEELMVFEARKTFDLSLGPCLRVALFQTGKDAYYFLLVMPHIVCDGWSLSIFFRELASLYEAFSAGYASPLSELPAKFSDYALWQQDWLDSNAFGHSF